ncbi:MAG: hypothetical protein ACOY3D_04655 [Candidatus Omnitrophota bacterium]
MANLSQVHLNFEKAWELADLEGRKHDLEWVKVVGKKYLEHFNKIGNFLIHEVFCSAIVVRYGRANTSGRKKKIPDKCFEDLTQKERDDHAYFMNLRNLHYAHSVNNYEYNIPKAWVNNKDSDNPELDQVGVVHNRVISLSVQEIRDIISLAEKLMRSLEIQIEKEKEEVLKIAKKMPISLLIKNKFPNIVNSKKAAGESRKRKI